jgi:hypothetical protein
MTHACPHCVTAIAHLLPTIWAYLLDLVQSIHWRYHR